MNFVTLGGKVYRLIGQVSYQRDGPDDPWRYLYESNGSHYLATLKGPDDALTSAHMQPIAGDALREAIENVL